MTSWCPEPLISWYSDALVLLITQGSKLRCAPCTNSPRFWYRVCLSLDVLIYRVLISHVLMFHVLIYGVLISHMLMSHVLISMVSISDMLTALIFLPSLGSKTLNFSIPYLLTQESIFELLHIIGKLCQRNLHWRGFDVGFECVFYFWDGCKIFVTLFSLTLLLMLGRRNFQPP